MQVKTQRRAVWPAFEGEPDGYLTAEEVFERTRQELPELSRSTIYDMLATFVGLELLRAVESHGAVLYDPDSDPRHHHFRCKGLRQALQRARRRGGEPAYLR